MIQEQGYKVDMKKSELLRGKSENRNCNEQTIRAVLSGEVTRRPKSKTPAPFKLKHKIYTKYFSPDSKAAEVEEIIDKALALYFSQHPKENHDPEQEDFNDF
ncbi:hypothetical protein [Paenibacillus dendritiformis]|uniref:hypothetical protein n=1 Tax=Paenibacillus dendritiformis TaxID=130049 RepID=UPI0018CF74B2|nr:hypothetical protein [Paenibacillus dendritiformis]